jgi:hypothetical protein
MRFNRWAGLAFFFTIMMGGVCTRQLAGQSLPKLYLCGDNLQDIAELRAWGGGDVQFMQFIDRNPVTGASAWPARITESFITQLVSATPASAPIMLDREDALYTTMLTGNGAAQLEAERWFDRMQDRVAAARAGAPLVGFYVGLLGYVHPPDQWWGYWRGQHADNWALAHSRAQRLGELLGNERHAVYVCVYPPSDEPFRAFDNAKMALAPWLELRRDVPGKVIACVSDRLINMRPDHSTPTTSEETFRGHPARGRSMAWCSGTPTRITGDCSSPTSQWRS